MIQSQLKLVYRKYISYAVGISIAVHLMAVGLYMAITLWDWSDGKQEAPMVFKLENLDFLLNDSKPKSSGSRASMRAKVSSDKDLKKMANVSEIVKDEKEADKKITDSMVVDTTAQFFAENGTGNGLGRGIGMGVGDEGGDGASSGKEKPVVHTNPRVRVLVQPNVEKVKNKINGSVRLRLHIDSQGNVVEAVVVNNTTKDKELQEIARKTANRMKFYPATNDGVPAEDWFDHEIVFNFDGKKL